MENKNKSYVSRECSEELIKTVQELKAMITKEAILELERQGFGTPEGVRVTKSMLNDTILSVVAAVCRDLLDASQYYQAVDNLAKAFPRQSPEEEHRGDFGIAG